MPTDFIIHAADDNVGIALRELRDTGAPVSGRLLHEGRICEVLLREHIPAGHKFALKNLQAGASVYRNGVDIGLLAASARVGALIHCHNLSTRRWHS